MPALVNTDKVIAADAAESTFKQCITVVEKKVRNLEKRKAKLDSYQLKQTEGIELNKDQKDAVSKYEVVLQNLEFARELQKQFQMMLAESEKMLRKQVKREKMERQQHETARMQSVLKLKTVLSGLLKSHVKADFLAGTRGALILNQQTVEQLCSFEQLIRDVDDLTDLRKVEETSEHIIAFLDGKDSPVVGTTYREIQDTVQQIIDCGYFSRLSGVLHQETDSQQDEIQPCNDLVPNGESTDPASLTSDPPSPLSCNSTSASITPSEMPPIIETIAAKLTLDESEPAESTANAINGQADECTADNEEHCTYVEEKPNDENAELPFTFETADNATVVCSLKKDAREIVSAFDGHFNFLQESLIDEEWTSPSSQTVTSSSATYPVSVSAFSTSHAIFTAPVATYAANSVFPASVDTFTPSYIADVVPCQPTFESPVSSEEAVTYANQYSAPLITTVPYITPPMMSEAYFAHHNVDYSHQVAYAAAYGSVMPNYSAEPIVPDNHVDGNGGVYPVGEEDISTVVDDTVGAAYEPASEVYAGSSFQMIPDGHLSNTDAAFSETVGLNKMESSALNPNASEFHSRFTPPLDCTPANVDCFGGSDDSGRIESLDMTDSNGDYQDLSRGNQCGFRGRVRGFRGGSRGGRYNGNRGGGYGQRNRNSYHRDGYINDYNGSAWRSYNRGGRSRGVNNMRNARGFTRNNASNHDVVPAEDSNNQQ